MKAIITLIHGTWAREAPWTRPDSALCQTLKATAEKIGAEVEFKPYVWSGANRLRARKEAARGLEQQLRQDFKQAHDSLHFLIAHSHGGNIMADALQEPGIGERVTGIVTMSTPFVSSRRSGIRITGAVFAALASLACGGLVCSLLSAAFFWVWNQSEFHITSPLLLWPVRLLLSSLAGGWAVASWAMLFV